MPDHVEVVDKLFNLKKSPKEPLRKFIHWFMRKMVEVENFDQKTTIVTFRKALSHGSLGLQSLEKSDLNTMKALL